MGGSGVPPPVRGFSGGSFDVDSVIRAIEVVRTALPYFVAGPPLVRSGPGGEVHVDVPLMYNGYALDRVHYDPYLKIPSPKGRPVRAWGVRVDPGEAREIVARALKEAVVVEAAEFRDAEAVWVVPVAWRHLVIAHVKVSCDGREIVPDYGLTEEVRRSVI